MREFEVCCSMSRPLLNISTSSAYKRYDINRWLNVMDDVGFEFLESVTQICGKMESNLDFHCQDCHPGRGRRVKRVLGALRFFCMHLGSYIP